jgi:glycine cleavage system H protein
MSELRFTKDHEWVSLHEGIATIGITAHAQQALGDVVFVELPEAGRVLASGEACAVVESVKAASDIYAPLAGRVVQTNPALAEDPSLVNRAPQAEGWFFRVAPDDPTAFAALLDATAYAAFVETL